MLDDAAIERFSRQILLPEVGGRGQERLGATRVTVAGAGDGAAFAETLLAAAGVPVERAGAPHGRIAITCEGGTVLGRARGTAAVVATLVGRPCARCVPDAIWELPIDGDDVHAPAAQAFGAVLAAETLRVALGLAASGRVQAFDLTRGAFVARPLSAAGCAACATVA